MRLSLRFLIPLLGVIGLTAYGVSPWVESLAFKWFVRDLDARTKLVSAAVKPLLLPLLERSSHGRSKEEVEALFHRVTEDERLYALGFCNRAGRLRYQTRTFPSAIGCEARDSADSVRRVIRLKQGSMHVLFQPLSGAKGPVGDLVIVHDMGFISRRVADTKAYVFYVFGALGLVLTILTVLIAELSWKGWIRGLRAVLTGERRVRPMLEAAGPELRPIVKDLRGLIRDLESDRRLRDASHIPWSPRAIKGILHRELSGDEVLIVSNREPYIHVRRNERIETQVPASGLVTALEPIMRACSGTWIAHGAGSADREAVDRHDRVQVPPEAPAYQIRRVWLSEEEESGYYYGFANEGLWALCHLAHVRPTFRSQDWAQYVAVNEKFARAVVDEAATDDPVVLVQDYHFALLPKMIKDRLPKATIIAFWHIPFPNPEVFSICPWREELLEGLLGSSILGFHTRFHCNNFNDSVDRFLEARIDRETSTISHGGDTTAVNAYPISIEYPVKWLKGQRPVAECRSRVRSSNGLPLDRLLGIGVDRLDYTKGVLERFAAVERLLEIHPEWLGRFTFVQIAAPSRSRIERYQHFEQDVRNLAERVNARFRRDGYEPILLKVEHHEPEQVYECYRASELCFVSSLHDGMNLVAKEFVAARDDERGVLILSQFTGAASELPESLIVNPYHTDQCAQALHMALTMPDRDQRERMRSMRGLIQEYNVYRWAGRMLLDAGRLRQKARLFESLRKGAWNRPRDGLLGA